jgi:hypothetical protein
MLAAVFTRPGLLAAWTIGLVLVGAAAYAELVLDIRVPRSTLIYSSAYGANTAYALDEYNKLSKKMHAQYGARAETALEIPPGRITVTVDGRISEQHRLRSRFSDAIGLIAFAPSLERKVIFPFRLEPGRHADRHGLKLADTLKKRFEKSLPAWMLAFTDRDWKIDTCVTLGPDRFGWAGRILRYRRGVACIVVWLGNLPHASMLISVNIADGDPWMRPITRRVCRLITEVALDRLSGDGERPPNYAACLLADRPGRKGAKQVLAEQVYEVRSGGALARLN